MNNGKLQLIENDLRNQIESKKERKRGFIIIIKKLTNFKRRMKA